MLDVVVVGAGMAGLVCAQLLRQAGYSTAVVEKSRGLGGRVATRRLPTVCADHGVRYLEAQGDRTQQLIQFLLDRNAVRPWTARHYRFTSTNALQPAASRPSSYAAPEGMTAIAKALATGLEIRRSQRVTALEPIANDHWRLKLETADAAPLLLQAKAVVLMIPAPQALSLAEPIAGLPASVLAALRSVEFDPCITAIAAYPPALEVSADLPWQIVSFDDDPILREAVWDSSKRQADAPPVFVLHSTAEFARQQFEAADDGGPAGAHQAQPLLDRAAETLIPWLNQPELVQIQRWRYAFVRRSLTTPALAAQVPLPLVCSGDWCGGCTVEAALRSGEAAAQAVGELVDNRPLPALRFADFGQ